MISFIVPTKNEVYFVERLLKSLKKYSGPCEVIVSDGGSTDGTIDVVRKYTDKIVVWKGSTRQAIAAGRNAGAHLASGKYLVFFDADVYIPDINTLMMNVETCFLKNPKVVAISGSLLVIPEYAKISDRLISSMLNTYFFLVNKIFGAVMVYGEFQITKRIAFENIGGFNENLVASEDYDLFRRLDKKVGKVKFIKNLAVYHTGRRAHKIGWATMIFRWFRNWLAVIITDKAFDKEWDEIR